MIYKDYKKIEENISKMDNVMFVLKDDAYGFKIDSIVKICMKYNKLNFCVNNVDEAYKIKLICKDSNILILGKCQCLNKDYIYTVSSLDDYYFMVKNNLRYHYKINISMNRFGFNEVIDYIINDKLCCGVYFHSNIINNELDLIKFSNMTKKYNVFKHIGGSVYLYNLDYCVRSGVNIYKDSLYITAKIVEIRNVLKGEGIGYFSNFIADKDCLIGVCNIGYSSGLSKVVNDIVFINNKFYKTIGYKCMDYTFILIDEFVKEFDEVEFIGKNISELTYASNNNISLHELYLKIK